MRSLGRYWCVNLKCFSILLRKFGVDNKGGDSNEKRKIVAPGRIELPSMVPETIVLSIKLRSLEI